MVIVHNPTCGCARCFPINYPERQNPWRHGRQTVPSATSYPSTFRTISGYRENDFCCATTCRDCGRSVFLIRHNGGYVLVDARGWPWPIHECYLREHPRGGKKRFYPGEDTLRSLSVTSVKTLGRLLAEKGCDDYRPGPAVKAGVPLSVRIGPSVAADDEKILRAFGSEFIA